MKPSIFIGIPSDDGTIRTGLFQVLRRWEKNPNYKIDVVTPNRLHPLSAARNNIVNLFLSSNYEYLLWIDDDVVPPIHTLDFLYLAKKDIISATCFCQRRDELTGAVFPYPVTLQYAPGTDQEYKIAYNLNSKNPIWEVDAVGGGCLLVKREVYEKIRKPVYELLFNDDGLLRKTCDFEFCYRAKQEGYKIFAHGAVQADHQTICSILSFNNLLVSVQSQHKLR